MTADVSESVEHEQRKNHHVISTAAYYRADEHEPDGCVYDEVPDWLEADVETEGAPYTKNGY